MTVGEALSRRFYATLGAAGLRRRTRPDWDSSITDVVAAYIGQRERVLDAGCGYGRIAEPLASRGYRVIGLDISELLLGSARDYAVERAIRLPLVAGNMARLPFRDASFDAVICLWSAYYEVVDVTDQVNVLAEMWRVLDNGGMALIEGPLSPADRVGLPPDRISRDAVEGIPSQRYVHDANTLSRRCADAGIADCEVLMRDWAGRERLILTFQK